MGKAYRHDYRRAYAPKVMGPKELKDAVGKDTVNKMKIHFTCNPRSTTFNVDNKTQIRKHSDGMHVDNRYTLHFK